MSKSTKIRDLLLNKGFFPEVLPPCFQSSNLAHSFRGIIKDVQNIKFQNKYSSYIRYSGTKHDGNRRYYGAVNPIPYFNLCNFIGKHWEEIDLKIKLSNLSTSNIKLGGKTDERSIIVQPLSEVATTLSSKIKYSPFILKTDIAQFFPSIYTHSIVWAAHGVSDAKIDTKRSSKSVYFNNLDWFIQQCQNGQTRGIIVGPDAFRIIAEFLASEIDILLDKEIGNLIIGGVRHVDDFYIGIKSEYDSSIVLSKLREILQNFELQINDTKTSLLPGLHPIDDIWAQEMRSENNGRSKLDHINYLIDKAFEISKITGSQSSMKLALRRIDKYKLYNKIHDWNQIETKLQRILYHFPHCIDYLCLLLAKRVAIEKEIDLIGWKNIFEIIIERSIYANHHHEIVWLLWTAFVCKIEISEKYILLLCKMENSFIKSILIGAYKEGLCKNISPIKLGNKLSTDDEKWLHHLIARSTGFSKSSFSGDFAGEFEKLVEKGIKFIDFKKHMRLMNKKYSDAISKSKYGYDADKEENDEEDIYDSILEDYDYIDDDESPY